MSQRRCITILGFVTFPTKFGPQLKVLNNQSKKLILMVVFLNLFCVFHLLFVKCTRYFTPFFPSLN